MSNSAESFFKGLILGTVAGAVAGILLAPKSGAETREDLKKMAIEVKDRTIDLYTTAKKRLEKKIAYLKKAGEKLDESKYKLLVQEVVDEIKNDAEVTSSASAKLAKQLKADWKMFSTALAK
jgi:gas vesicle protein